MDNITIANLEVELGCFDQGLVDIGLRKDHGGADKLFEVPAEAASRLDPASKTKSVYPFGADGTLAWATPAGELLQLASCTKGKLAGVDYKKSIERGEDYQSRTKMLQTALNLPQGSGNSIGLSLALNRHPNYAHWVHNRWPRFIYEFDGLEIRLQYYVTSQSVVQQYQIRNDGNEDISLPYIISTDILFRDHELESESFRPIPTQKTSERIMLSQNSELLMSTESNDVQFETAVFLNKQRMSVWMNHQSSDGEDEPGGSKDSEVDDQKLPRIEKALRDAIVDQKRMDPIDVRSYRYQYFLETSPGDRRLHTQNRTNFASFRNTLVVPKGSSQELCAIVKVSGPLQPEKALIKSASQSISAQSKDSAASAQSLSDNEETRLSEIRDEENAFNSQWDEYPFDLYDPRRKAQVIQLMQESFRVGRHLARVRQVKSSRYYFFTGSLIAEVVYKEDIDRLNGVRFRYAETLLQHGWYSDGLKKVEDLVQNMSNEGDKKTKLWSDVLKRLASVYLSLGRFSEAESLYQEWLQHFTKDDSVVEPVSAPIWEKIAWAKVNQGQYEKAIEIYTDLLGQNPASGQVLLSNLGFVKRRLGQFADAKVFYERAINEKFNNDSRYETNKIYARSGLSSCLRSLRATQESIDEQSVSSLKYIDINDTLSQVQYSPLSSKENVFDFVASRHLEILLSICSIPIKGNGASGIMFIDADPVECAYEGRPAFFQFKFLIQYHQRLAEMNHHGSVNGKRIQATCEDHLVWVFKIAPTLNTWLPQYSVSGASGTSSSETDALSHVVEGAFHFLKLCLYHERWTEKWALVLELLHLTLDKWLSHLVSTQHMSNLWVEYEGFEILKPQHDSLSDDRDTICQAYPQYELSDFSVLWLALMQLEHLIASIGHTINIENRDREDTDRLKLQKVREAFNSCRPTLSPENIQSKIIETFKVFNDTTTNSIRATAGEPIAFTGLSDNSPMSGDPKTNVEISHQAGTLGRKDQQLIVFRRTIKECIYEVQPSDVTTLEAYTFGMFENPQDQAAWHATINVQEEKNTTTPWETRLIALALFGLKKGQDVIKINEDKTQGFDSKEDFLRTTLSAAAYDSGCFAYSTTLDQPEQIQSWSGVNYETLFVLMLSLYEKCQTLFVRMIGSADKVPRPSNRRQEGQAPLKNSQRQIPTTKSKSRTQVRKTTKKTGAIDTFPIVNQQNVYDTGFLPDWMYHYPSFIHKETLVLSSWNLDRRSAIEKLKPGEIYYYPLISNAPAICDFGRKTRTNPDDAFPERQLNIGLYYDMATFWAQLLKPRTYDKAKKRLVELSGGDKDSASLYRLSSPVDQQQFLSDFFRRNDDLENFFGERADLTANLWETELHLGFYQLLDATDSPSRDHSREMPSLSKQKVRRTVAPVALSFRFVGDLRDRLWTCLFLSSETIGFKGLVQQHYKSFETDSELYERQGQRKTLELFYVERILHEMVTSVTNILVQFKIELAVSPQSQNFDFIYHYSGLRFHSDATEILQDVSQKLDLSIKVIEDWKKREDTRGLRSRWSLKDDARYGKTLNHLTQKCKKHLRDLRMQHNQLGEQRKDADKWYSNLMSYKSLQEAHASTRLGEDVRLFTYVTIVFLPLSFSSSLFSMSGTPHATTLTIMGPTTVIALVLTILLLANMNLLNRKLRFWFEKAKHKTREEMAKTGGKMAKTRGEMASRKMSSLCNWVRVSEELTKAAQLQDTGTDTKERLPAESKWWYFYFWLCYCFRWPTDRVRRGLLAWENGNGPSLRLLVRILLALVCSLACALIFMVEVLLHMIIDTIALIRAMLRRTQNRRQDEGNSGGQDGEETDMEDSDNHSVTTTASTASKRRSVWVRILEKLDHSLEYPPRPIDDFRNKYFPSLSDQEAKHPARGLPRDGMDELFGPLTNGVAEEPDPEASTNLARGTTTDETRTQAGDLV